MLASGLVGADGAFTTMLERGTAVGFVDSRENDVVGRLDIAVTELLSPTDAPLVAALVPEATLVPATLVPDVTEEATEVEAPLAVAGTGGTWRALI